MQKIVTLLIATLVLIFSSCSKSSEPNTEPSNANQSIPNIEPSNANQPIPDIEPYGTITSTSEDPIQNLKVQNELWNGIYYGMKENDLLKEFPTLSLSKDNTYLLKDFQILEVPYRVEITLDDNGGVQYINLINETQNWAVSPESHSQSLIDLFTYKYGNDYTIDDDSKGEMTNKLYTWIHDTVIKIRVRFLFYSSFSVGLGYPNLKRFAIYYTYINTINTEEVAKI